MNRKIPTGKKSLSKSEQHLDLCIVCRDYTIYKILNTSPHVPGGTSYSCRIYAKQIKNRCYPFFNTFLTSLSKENIARKFIVLVVCEARMLSYPSIEFSDLSVVSRRCTLFLHGRTGSDKYACLNRISNWVFPFDILLEISHDRVSSL